MINFKIRELTESLVSNVRFQEIRSKSFEVSTVNAHNRLQKKFHVQVASLHFEIFVIITETVQERK